MNLSVLGLCYLARKIVFSDDILPHLKKNKVALILIASDASLNTTKKFTDKANFYGCEVINSVSSYDISLNLGKANIKVIGILDRGFAKLIKKEVLDEKL
ncbi:MAG: hypothetical protein LBV58_01270 [Acholeplasmatales bacterium]|jgi:ribosomal protein L7Ae-like RNA K-turn-binding protein|nr:hypothetical protein [Acholeplasmatales bacterium]